MRTLLAIAVLALLPAVIGCEGERSHTPDYAAGTGGDPNHGKQVISDYGCGSCHTIPGVRGANGAVGPPLYFMGRRTMIAGELPNTPDNIIRWIKNPKSVEPGTAMPALGLTDEQARDAAAYLYTLR